MMRISLFTFPFLLLTAISCNNRPSVPADVIAVDKMTAVLGDMMLADEFASVNVSKDSLLESKKENAGLYEKVFAVHGITKAQFVKSYKYYEGDPVRLKVIFDSLNSRMTHLRNGYYPRQSTKPTAPAGEKYYSQ